MPQTLHSCLMLQINLSMRVFCPSKTCILHILEADQGVFDISELNQDVLDVFDIDQGLARTPDYFNMAWQGKPAPTLRLPGGSARQPWCLFQHLCFGNSMWPNTY